MDDSTEYYIMMCEKAKEIQELWKPSRGDFVYDIVDNDNIWHSRGWHIITSVVTDLFQIDQYQGTCKKEKYIWLPRQDQLQDITGIKSIPTLLSRFNEFVFGDIEYASCFVDSCEQLWLAFVMKTKFGKMLDLKVKDWVKEE